MAAERAQYSGMDSDYSGRMKTLGQDIRSRLQAPHGKLLYGPTYHMTTSRNVPIHIHSFAVQYRDALGDRKGYYLVGQDDSGAIIGHVYGDFRMRNASFLENALFGKEEVLVVGSKVVTAFRGEGLAPLLVLSHRAFLQHEADTLGVPVTMVVSNANREALQEARRWVAEYPGNAELRRLLAEKEAEQIRWQQMWRDHEEVRFDPQKQGRRNANQGDIYLVSAEGRKFIPQVERAAPDTRSLQQKQAQFHKLMLAIDALAA